MKLSWIALDNAKATQSSNYSVVSGTITPAITNTPGFSWRFVVAVRLPSLEDTSVEVPSTTPPPPPETTPKEQQQQQDLNVVMLAGVGGGVFLVSILLCYCFCVRKKARPPTQQQQQSAKRSLGSAVGKVKPSVNNAKKNDAPSPNTVVAPMKALLPSPNSSQASQSNAVSQASAAHILPSNLAKLFSSAGAPSSSSVSMSRRQRNNIDHGNNIPETFMK